MSQDSPRPLQPPDPPGHPPLPAVIPEYRTVAGQVAGGPFLPWMRELALWIVSPTETVSLVIPGVDGKPPETKKVLQPLQRRVTVSDLTREASRLSGWKISRGALRHLRNRPEFRVLVARLEESILVRAKHRLEHDFDFYAQSHRAGLEMALDAGDHRAIPSFTGPMLDRITPKKEQKQDGPRSISIVVHQDTANRLARIDEPIVDAEFTVESAPKDAE